MMIEYARCDVQPVAVSLYATGFGEFSYFPFSYTLLEGEGHIALVDVGFDTRSRFVDGLLHEFSITDCASPDVVLGKVGLTPEEIDTIFITHAHYDHMGALSWFPNAQVYLQRREIERWEVALALPERFQSLAASLDPADVLYARQLEHEGRLKLVDGVELGVLPGVDVRPAFDTHTDGSQYVVVNNSADTWVVTGDNVYSYRNVETSESKPGYTGIGYSSGSLWASLHIIDEMLEHATSSMTLAIGHEGETYDRFPSVRGADRLAVAQLRVAPNATSRLGHRPVPSPTGDVAPGRRN
jgi:N-acyl homoserine lactone hydrolase